MLHTLKTASLMICLLILMAIITGCAKKASLQYDNKLNGGGTIIGNPEPYAPAPMLTAPEDGQEQALIIDADSIVLLNTCNMNGVKGHPLDSLTVFKCFEILIPLEKPASDCNAKEAVEKTADCNNSMVPSQ